MEIEEEFISGFCRTMNGGETSAVSIHGRRTAAGS